MASAVFLADRVGTASAPDGDAGPGFVAFTSRSEPLGEEPDSRAFWTASVVFRLGESARAVRDELEFLAALCAGVVGVAAGASVRLSVLAALDVLAADLPAVSAGPSGIRFAASDEPGALSASGP